MSHSRERHEKICLNCNAPLVGRYCHACGQENIEPRDSVWGLITHFFNDITHFDGKFFSTARSLILRPGKLPKEYMAGRRASYLHPIRMYVFTSAIFFLVFFSIFTIHDLDVMDDVKDVAKVTSALNADSIRSKALQAADTPEDSADIEESLEVLRDLNFRETKPEKPSAKDVTEAKPAPTTTVLQKDTAQQKPATGTGSYRYRGASIATHLDSATLTKSVVKRSPNAKDAAASKIANDSSRSNNHPDKNSAKKTTYTNKGLKFQTSKSEYASIEEYDSAQIALPPDERDGWLDRRMAHRNIEMNIKYKGNEDKLIEDVVNKFTHTFPYLLFVSLPLYALFLKLLYLRRGTFFYVDHVMFLIYLYIFTFVFLLLFIGVDKLRQSIDTQVGLGWLEGLMVLAGIYYGYKAMRNFYGQSRGKTLLKFLLFNFLCSITIWLLFGLFFMLTIFQI